MSLDKIFSHKAVGIGAELISSVVTIFAVVFVATDYLQYRMKSPYIKGVIWKRVLGDNTATAVNPGNGT